MACSSQIIITKLHYPWAVYCDRHTQLYLKGRRRGEGQTNANLKFAFNAYVRPILEYASPIWSPHTQKDIDLLENVQRRFTKSISKLHYLPYTTRLSSLNIYQLFLVAVHISISALSTASCITIPIWIHHLTSLFVLHLSLVATHLLSKNHLLDLILANFLSFLVLLTFGTLYL